MSIFLAVKLVKSASPSLGIAVTLFPYLNVFEGLSLGSLSGYPGVVIEENSNYFILAGLYG